MVAAGDGVVCGIVNLNPLKVKVETLVENSLLNVFDQFTDLKKDRS